MADKTKPLKKQAAPVTDYDAMLLGVVDYWSKHGGCLLVR
jgi:hypothetical protein